MLYVWVIFQKYFRLSVKVISFSIPYLPGNLPLDTAIERVEIAIDGTTVSSDSADYGYRSYIENALCYPNGSKITNLAPAGYFPHVVGYDAETAEPEENPMLAFRGTVYMVGN